MGVISTPDPPEKEVFLRPDNRLLSSNLKQKFTFEPIRIQVIAFETIRIRVITLFILSDLSHFLVKKTLKKYFSGDQRPICDTFHRNADVPGLELRQKSRRVTVENKHGKDYKTITCLIKTAGNDISIKIRSKCTLFFFLLSFHFIVRKLPHVFHYASLRKVFTVRRIVVLLCAVGMNFDEDEKKKLS